MQYVCDGVSVAWDDWLHAMFDARGTKVTPGFWRRHRHHELVARWADVVGPDHLTVLAVREGDRGGVLRDAEGILGLEPGFLHEQEALGNRSLTWPEVEAVRRFNQRVRRDGLSRMELQRVMHFGASRFIKDEPADPAAPRIELPDWVLPLVRAEADANVAGIRGTGVRVVGDLAALAEVPPPSGRPLPDGAGDPAVAASLGVGVLIATGMAQPGPAAEREDMSTFATRAIAGHVARRVAKAALRRMPLPRGRRAPEA
jgi:hypothetical protein